MGYEERAVVIVPARLASTRFPEKVLAAKTGKPLVQHVVEAASRAKCARMVVVAADDVRVVEALKPYGTRVVLTRADHANGTSRLAEAAALLGLGKDEIIVNAQGDEPELPGAVIDAAVGALTGCARASVGTVASPFGPGEDPANQNLVKVVRGVDGCALYFTRSLVPFDRDRRGEVAPLRHVGIYAYRRAFLEKYAAMASTALERCEQLEQLRVLENGFAIAVAVAETGAGGIDTLEQYEAFVERWKRRSESQKVRESE